MDRAARIALVALVCMTLPGCSVRMQASQSASGGTSTTASSSQVSGSSSFSGGRLSVSSGGRPVSPKASGGYVSASGSAAAVLVVGLVIADLVNYIRGDPQPKPLPPGTAISHTCSCYGQSVSGEQ